MLSQFWHFPIRQDIITWALENIDFSEDVSAERSRLDLSLTPHLVEPLRMWDFRGKIREMTVIGIEQHGKTLIEVIGALYSMVHHPANMLCVYPSDELAAKVNLMKYEPLIRKIPELAPQLDRKGTHKEDRYIFRDCSMFYQGAGVKVMSTSAKIRIIDEFEQFPVIKDLDNVEDTRKRGRSYSESMFCKVTSPGEKNSAGWKEFLKGSQAYWTLQCQSCGAHSMRSCDFNNFQFESEKDQEQDLFVPIPGTTRLICPKCGHSHTEPDKYAMNRNGKYIPVHPERHDLMPSFQFGALCSLFPYMSWESIAAKILECGKHADIAAHKTLDNSYKGLPYTPRRISTNEQEGLKQHMFIAPPDPDTIECVFMVSDTQDTFSPTGIFAYDTNSSVWLLDYSDIPYIDLSEEEKIRIESDPSDPSEKPDIFTLADRLTQPVRIRDREFPILFHIIDYRGHRQKEVSDYAAKRNNVFMYAGNQLRYDLWTPVNGHPRLYSVSAKEYQRRLLESLLDQTDKSEYYYWLPSTLPQEILEQISCLKPSNRVKFGHLKENWEPENGRVHDAFDVLKMALWGIDFAIANFRRSRFLHGTAPAILKHYRTQQPQQSPPRSQTPTPSPRQSDTSHWFR